ncbi:hypothetical protein PILCRDRAFT_4925 [Piloderma croceum F 1598]|uniref:DNA polymerase delta subunit 3 n=1 Tax=Piloderma croceum (strain F 1598) TaxID=765440 RepID=A0A0C3G6Z9_PILCF|nr:hypothetical protein PILCRDRAFT_4925 [Piloderma croceum F 1598]
MRNEVPPTRKGYDDEMDVDDDDEKYLDNYDEEEDEGFMPETKIVLVGDDNLESSKSQFSCIFSTYIYALSPAPIRYQDKGKSKETEVGKGVEKGVEWGKMVGKIMGAHVVVMSPSILHGGMQAGKQPIASTSTSISETTTKLSSTKDDPKSKSNDTSTTDKLEPKPTEKPKATGKLCWSNAKTKEAKETNEAKKKESEVKKEEAKKNLRNRAARNVNPPEDFYPTPTSTQKKKTPPYQNLKPNHYPNPNPKRPPAKEASSARVKRGVIFSSDEDEEPQPPKKRLQRGKGKWDQVIRVPRNPPSTTNPSTASGSPPEDVEEEDVDVEMAAADEDLKIKPTSPPHLQNSVAYVDIISEANCVFFPHSNSQQKITPPTNPSPKTKIKSPTSDETATTNKKPTSDESPAESDSKDKAAGSKSTGTGKATISTKGKTGRTSKKFFAKK